MLTYMALLLVLPVCRPYRVDFPFVPGAFAMVDVRTITHGLDPYPHVLRIGLDPYLRIVNVA